MGHLIDSAANNHQRFVRAQEGSDLVLPGYSQDHWVGVQGYQDAPWDDIIALWRAYNRHLARVIERAFRDAYMMLDRRISLFLSLPLAGLDQLAIKREIDRIGEQ